MDPRPRRLTARKCSPYRACAKVELLILVRLLLLLTGLLLLILLLRYQMFPSTAIASAACCTSCTSP